MGGTSLSTCSVAAGIQSQWALVAAPGVGPLLSEQKGIPEAQRRQ